MTRTIRLTLACGVALATSFGCGGQPAAGAQPGTQHTASPPSSGQTSERPGQPAQSADAVRTVSGTVAETMDAASYTYVRVKTADGEVWAATSRFPVSVGDRVVVPLEMPMTNFHSQSLNRDFPLIYFASAITREGDAPPGAAGMSGMSSHTGAPADAPTVSRVPLPEGGTSVADVWAKRAALAGKPVTVRGTVVKYNGGILGRNWLHIQDGTGTAGQGTHDLTVTTTDPAKVGDVVTATGTLAIDKDFGAGYRYAVIVEDASLRAK